MDRKVWLGIGFAIFVLLIIGSILVFNIKKEDSSNTNTTISNTPVVTTIVQTTSPGVTTTSIAPTDQSHTVKIYFSKHPDSDNDVTKVFSVDRTTNSSGVATFALQQLIAGPTSSESTKGYYTDLTQSLSGTSNCNGADFTINLDSKNGTPETGTTTVKFCKDTSLAGDLTGARIENQIKSTLMQFNTIKKVIVLNKNGNCFNDLSGLNLCLK